MSFSISAQEQELVKAVFAKANLHSTDLISEPDAFKIFNGSGLPRVILTDIWKLAGGTHSGFLTPRELSIALRLIGWAQAGEKANEELISRVGPLPTFKGIPIPGIKFNPGVSRASVRPSAPLDIPPLTAEDRQKFLDLFMKNNPENGLLSGARAQAFFLKSKLSAPILDQIWSLADTRNRDLLDATDFVIGMYFIQSIMSGALQDLPTTLYTGLYEQARGSMPSPPLKPRLQINTTDGLAFQQSVATPENATKIRPTDHTLFQPHNSKASASATSVVFEQRILPHPHAPVTDKPSWPISAELRAKSDGIFATLDLQGRGTLQCDVAVDFLLKSELPEPVLSQIWDLADQNDDGELDPAEFAIMFYLLNEKLSGREILGRFNTDQRTSIIPDPLIQDEMFEDVRPIEKPLEAHTPVKVAFPSIAPSSNSSHCGFFDGDAHPVNHPSVITQSMNLMDVRNHLSSTQHALDSAIAAQSSAAVLREALEAELALPRKQLAELQEKLKRALVARESEEARLVELRARRTQQDTDLAKAREELLCLESQANAARQERDAVVLELEATQKQAWEVANKAGNLRASIENNKREAAYATGLIQIARNQIASGENEIDVMQAEVVKARQELAKAKEMLENVEKQLPDDSNRSILVVTPSTLASVPKLDDEASGLHHPALGPTVVSKSSASRSIHRYSLPSNSKNPFVRMRYHSTSSPRVAIPSSTLLVDLRRAPDSGLSTDSQATVDHKGTNVMAGPAQAPSQTLPNSTEESPTPNDSNEPDNNINYGQSDTDIAQLPTQNLGDGEEVSIVPETQNIGISLPDYQSEALNLGTGDTPGIRVSSASNTEDRSQNGDRSEFKSSAWDSDDSSDPFIESRLGTVGVSMPSTLNAASSQPRSAMANRYVPLSKLLPVPQFPPSASSAPASITRIFDQDSPMKSNTGAPSWEAFESPVEIAQRSTKLGLHLPSFELSKTIKANKKGKKEKDKNKDTALDTVGESSSSDLVMVSWDDDNMVAIKTLCGMGFSQIQAINALETNGYNLERAVLSLIP